MTLGTIFLLLGAVIIGKSIHEIWLSARSRDFIERTAELVDAQAVNDDGYQVQLSYRYNLDGVDHLFSKTAADTFGNVSIFLRSSAERRAAELLAKGGSITVYVDPDRPARARTTRGVNPTAIATAVLGGLFFLIGLRLLVWD